MTETKGIILKLKEIREERNLSFTDIMRLMEENGDYIAKSTLSRVFSEGSEDLHFKYEETIRPIANALLDIEHIEATDDMDVTAMKLLLRYKISCIEELEEKVRKLEAQLDKEKIKNHEKLEKEREQSRRSIEFLKDQINLKDKRMDLLLDTVKEKDIQYREVLSHILKYRSGKK